MAYEMTNEGKTTTLVESQTSKAPSLVYLGLAVSAMAASAALVLTGRKQLGNFIGQWAPSILIMGVYNKIAKEAGAQQRGHAMGVA
jgi:limonene-1,2-epoxide hydrolase